MGPISTINSGALALIAAPMAVLAAATSEIIDKLNKEINAGLACPERT